MRKYGKKRTDAYFSPKQGEDMPDGGFLVKINGKKVARCYAVAFDYDEWQYKINNKKPKALPKNTESISVEVES